MRWKKNLTYTRTLFSLGMHTSNVQCEERERLTQAYLEATENSRKVSDSIEDIHSPEWLEAIKEAREICKTTLAALKLHISEHNCGTLKPKRSPAKHESVNVEVFYFRGCPLHEPAVERVKSVMKEQGIAAMVAQVEVTDAEAAEAVGFLGSPTIRVNGLDIDPASRSARGGGFACRCYAGGLPSEDMIRAALFEAQGLGQ